MRNPVKKTAAKKPTKKKKSSVKWVTTKGTKSKGGPSTAITGGHYEMQVADDGYTEVHLTGQNGAFIHGYACKDVSTAELLVTLIEEGRLIP